MTQPMDDVYQNTRHAVPVKVENWQPTIEYRARKTTIQTFILDPAGGTKSSYQIASYEPARVRLVIVNADAAITVQVESAPRTSPEPNTMSTDNPPEGGYLPQVVNGPGWEFYGDNPMWMNAVTTRTRVTVIKEYQ